MGQGVQRKVFPYWWTGDLCAPAEEQVDGREAYCKVSGRVLGPKGGEGGEGLWESGRGRVCVRGGAGNPEGGKASPVSAVGDNGGGQASRDRMEVGVEKKLFVVHLWTLCQKPFMPLSAA